MNRNEINMTEGRMLPKLLRFVVPLMLSSLLQLAFNAADLIVVGRFGRPNALAAVGSNVALVSLVVNTFMGLSIGGTVMIAQYGGQKRFDQQRKTIGNVTTLYLILSVVVTAVMLTVGRGLLVVLNTPQSAFTEAESYYNICMAGTVFMLVPPIVIFMLAQKNVIETMAHSGIK